MKDTGHSNLTRSKVELRELAPRRFDGEEGATGSKPVDLEASLPLIGESVSRNDVTVVIPTLNESVAIGKVIDDVKGKGFDNILVVDGHSTDGTAEIARNKGAIVAMQHGPGKAGALKTAVGIVRTPYMVVMDGDDTYKADDIEGLLLYGKEFDEVIGARARGRENIPAINRFGNWIISRVFKLFFGVPITDVLSGMYLLNTSMMRDVMTTSASFDIEVEIASAMATSGEVTQVPISYGRRLGQQKLRPSHGGRILSTLFWMAYYYNPVFLFGAVVALLAVPASGIILWVIFEGIFFGIWHGVYAIFGLGIFILASQAGAIALISLLLKRSEERLTRQLRRTNG